MKKLTPVILVEEIEPCLTFWTDRFGFARTVEVPEGEKLGFVALANGPVEIMYQSRASMMKDMPAMAREPFSSRTNLYIEVDRLEDILPGTKGAEMIFGERKTFYGSREIGVRAPCGTSVVFAQFESTE